MRYLILGPLEVRNGETDVALPGGQQRKLLAILLLHSGEAVSSDRLIDELWDGKPPETAAKALQGYVSSLRKQLGPETVETVGAGYRLKVAPEDLDSHRFAELLAEARPLERAPAAEKLREALALWRGPALADFAYDDFARNEIDRLEELRLSAIERRIDLELALGHHEDLVPELEALVRAHPLREHLSAELMLALYRSGRQADALRLYGDARRMLRDELGLEPSEELQRLQRSILEHDDSVEAPPPPIVERVLRRPGWIVLIGAVLLAGAIAAAAFELTRESTAVAALPDSVAAIDPATNRVVADIPVGQRPDAIAYGLGSLWVANGDSGTVTRIDPRSKRPVATIGIGGDVADLAVGFGSVWVADGNAGTVTQINRRNAPYSIQFGAQNPLQPKPIFSIATGAGYVWATREDGIVRIDPTTYRKQAWLSTAPATGVAVGSGRIWVTTADERILRYSASGRDARPTQEIQTPAIPIDPVLAGGKLWAIVPPSPYHELWRIDPDSGTSLQTQVGNFPVSAAWDRGSMWVANQRGRVVVRIRPGRLSPVARIPLEGDPAAVASGDGLVWVAVDGTT
jgi:YVTN family beta-propeller protein